jgi:L-rhamnonate dehydratase
MPITRVATFQPIAADSPPDWRTSLGQIAVRIETDAGLVGFGVGGGGAAGMHVIREILAPLLAGRDPAPVEALWDEMYAATLPFGRKGIAVMALSGVDLALWDLRGKAAGTPLVEVLGGRRDAVLPTYTTVWEEVDAATARAPQAVKLHVKVTDKSDPVGDIVRKITAARRAIGPDRDLMVDAWMLWNVDMTLRIAERIERLRIGWIEEPLSPDDLSGFELLSRHCPFPIAGGEHEFTAVGFRELIDRKLHAVLQPDVCWCGGLTELVKIYRHANAAGLRVVPHRGSEVWALHGVAALQTHPLAESGRPWMSWVEGQPAIVDGTVTVPDKPGFGVEIREPAPG